jgi:hypothetical protein
LFGNLLLQTGGANIGQAKRGLIPYASALPPASGSFLRHAAEILDSPDGDH